MSAPLAISSHHDSKHAPSPPLVASNTSLNSSRPSTSHYSMPPLPTLPRFPALSSHISRPSAPSSTPFSNAFSSSSQMPSSATKSNFQQSNQRQNQSPSPLVDLDQLCNLLGDNGRNDDISELLSMPSDFPMPGSMSSRNSNNNQARSVFNISPSDIISLD